MSNPLFLEDTMPTLIFSLLRCDSCKIRYAVFRRDDQFYYYDSSHIQNSTPLYVVATSDPLVCPAPSWRTDKVGCYWGGSVDE